MEVIVKNCIQQEVRFVNSNKEVILTLPAAQTPVIVTRASNDANMSHRSMLLVGDLAIPVDAAMPPTGVDGLPEDDGEPILVPLVVAEAMKALGIKRLARVFTPMPLVFSEGPNKHPIGTPGLILHEELYWHPVGDPTTITRAQ